MYQLPDTLPFAAFINPKIAFTQNGTIAFQYNQVLQSYAGDPLAGKLTPGTQIEWNKATAVQQLIFEYYNTQGAAQNPVNPGLPSDLQQIMEQNAGPNERWNYSYEQWGVVPGVPAAVTTINTVEVGTGRAVTVILP